MIDINTIRNNKKDIENALEKRMTKISLDSVIDLDDERRRIFLELSQLQEYRNKMSKYISLLKKQNKDTTDVIDEMKIVANNISILKTKLKHLESKIFEFISALPNIPDVDVEAGGKENNKILKVYKEKPEFSFNAKDHVTLATELGLIDYKRGVKLAGQGSWIYTGIGAQLEWALINYFIDSHLQDNWEFMLVPHMLNYECGYTAGQFPKFKEEVYWLDGGCRENGKFKEEELPKKYFSYTPCYRREAGSSRVEERGTVRGHQFNKVEMIQYTAEGDSERAFDEMVEKAERLVQKLELHYRLSKLAAGDCSASMCRTSDIEVWIPSMGIYKEVSSVSNSRDYQARRGNMKYRDKVTGKTKYMNTLNASGLATSRLIPALLEQNQLEDGSVIIPKVLKKYMGGLEKIY